MSSAGLAWRARGRVLAVALLALTLVQPEAGRAQPAASQAPLRFDIPTEPLEQALNRFAEVSGMDVLYSQAIASGRRSAAVTGALTPPQAMAVLLTGTGLSSRFTSPRSVVVFMPGATDGASVEYQPRVAGDTASLDLDPMRVTAPRLIGAPSRDPFRDYAERAQSDIRHSLDAAQLVIDGRAYEILVSTRIGPDGSLRDVRILRSGQDRLHDSQIVALLTALRLASEPPPNMPQPLIFDVRLQ